MVAVLKYFLGTISVTRGGCEVFCNKFEQTKMKTSIAKRFVSGFILGILAGSIGILYWKIKLPDYSFDIGDAVFVLSFGIPGGVLYLLGMKIVKWMKETIHDRD